MQFANIDDLTVIANEIKKKANTTDLGTAAAANTTNSVTQGSGDLPTAGAVWTAIDNLPEPMIMKGTLGTGGTITSLPTASASNEGFVYKVITAGTYAGQAAVVGDFFVSCKPEGASDYSWVWFPSGDESFSDTWRNIKVNGTEKLGTGISSGAVDFVDGTNTTVAFDTNGNKVSVSVPAVSSANAGVAPKGNAVSSQDQNTKFLREDGTWAKPSYTTDTNTHRPIQVNDTQVLGDNTTPLDLKAGSNVTISADGGNVTISAQDTTYSDATTSASGLMSASDKTKLDGVASGAEVNQNAFSNVKVGETTIVADNKTDTLELVAGSNVTITPDAINDKLTISAQDTTYSDATTSASGLMSASDKTKLDGIANGATKTAVSSVNGKVKINDVDTLVYDDTELQNKTATDDVSIEGNPLSFETGYSQYSKSTLIDLEPIQDLHGYDKPWVGGAGKNKFGGSVSTSNAATYAFTLPADLLTFTISVVNGTNKQVNAKIYDMSNNTLVADFKIVSANETGSISKTISEQGKIVIYVVSGTSEDVPLVTNVQVEAGSIPTSYAPYTNICPISGRTEVNLENDINSVFTIEQGVIDSQGLNNNSNIRIRTKEYIDVNAGDIVYFVGSNNLNKTLRVLVSYYDKNDYVTPRTGASTSWENLPCHFEIPSGVKYIRASYSFSDDSNITPSNINNCRIFTKAQDITISLGQTVYGGQIDLEKGECVVDKVIKTIDGSDANDGYGSQSGYYVQIDTMAKLSDYSTSILSDKFITLSDYLALANVDYGISGYKDTNNTYPNQNWIYIKNVLAGSSRNEYRTWLSNNPVQVTYFLATPITITLTPNTINLLKGSNYITTDGDKINLVYREGVLALAEELDKNYVHTDNNYTDEDKTKVSNSTKVESSATNGHIEIDDVDTTVYDDTAVQNAIDNIEDELSTDYATVEGNPLNFNTLSAQKSKSTILSVEPIQDLHGYSKPWAGGAGKNKLPMTVDGIKALNTSGSWSGNVYTYLGVVYTLLTDTDNNITGIKVTGNNTSADTASALYCISAFSLTGSYIGTGCPSGGSSTTYRLRVAGGNDYGSGTNLTDITSQSVYIRIEPNYTIPTGGLTFYPMIRLSTETDPTFAPYTNICPISGRTEVNLDGCGFNLWDEEWESGTLNPQGQPADNQIDLRSKNFNRIIGGLNYYFNVSTTTTGLVRYIFWYDADKNFISYTQYLTNVNVAPNNAFYFKLVVTTYIQKEGTYKNNICINISKPTGTPKDGDYVPYNLSNDLTISFGQTVYGGSLDVENGVLVVDRGYQYEDGSNTTNLSIASGQLQIAIDSNSIVNTDSYHTTGKLISNRFEEIYNNSQSQNGIYFRANGSHNLLVRGNDYTSSTTLEEWVTWLQSNPLQVVYALATPITINLTPNIISLLEGVNNISTDGDKITLTYRDGSVATLGDLTSAVDNLDSKIDESKILTDTATGDKYILVVTNGVLSVEQVSN